MTPFLVLEFPHQPNSLKPQHHQQDQIKLPFPQASHIFPSQCVCFPIFPHQKLPKKTHLTKPPKQQETYSPSPPPHGKVNRSRSTHPKHTVREEAEKKVPITKRTKIKQKNPLIIIQEQHINPKGQGLKNTNLIKRNSERNGGGRKCSDEGIVGGRLYKDGFIREDNTVEWGCWQLVKGKK